MVNLGSHIAFWKKRDAAKSSEPKRIIPLPNLSSPILDTSPTAPAETVDKAREALKVLMLERQIIGSAVTTIYESHSKGVISQTERDRMLEKYKLDLKRLETSIDENQHVVELHDLEVERREVIKSFNAKLAEIDARLKNLKSGSPTQKLEKHPSDEGKGAAQTQNGPSPAAKDDPAIPTTNDSEKRIELIREELLKAMDRLEQIETEG